MDEAIGRLLAALEETDQANNTLVLFMTDHGGDPRYGGSNEPLRGGKATLYEGGLRVPCLARWPGVTTPGTQSDSIVTMLDMYPTLAEIIGFPTHHDDLHGQSFLPVLRGESPTQHKPIVWATGSHAELDRQSWVAVRDGVWKWIAAPNKSPELFRLDRDPLEQHDVSADYPGVAKRLARMAELGATGETFPR
ncbi:MAG: sulfatase-like hydrolase/transferase [Planctomycetota bacterium]